MTFWSLLSFSSQRRFHYSNMGVCSQSTPAGYSEHAIVQLVHPVGSVPCIVEIQLVGSMMPC